MLVNLYFSTTVFMLNIWTFVKSYNQLFGLLWNSIESKIPLCRWPDLHLQLPSKKQDLDDGNFRWWSCPWSQRPGSCHFPWFLRRRSPAPTSHHKRLGREGWCCYRRYGIICSYGTFVIEEANIFLHNSRSQISVFVNNIIKVIIKDQQTISMSG